MAERAGGGAVPWLLVLPMLLLIGGVILLPELWALYLSFTDYAVGQTATFVGTGNYATLLASRSFWMAALRTLGFVVVAVSLEMLAGVTLACVLHRAGRLRGVWIACLVAPVAMSQAVTASAWGYLLDPNTGPLNYAFGMLGLPRQNWLGDAASALLAVAVIEFWAGMPHVLIFLYPVRRALPQELYEAAAVDGATPLQSFRHVTWPLLQQAFLVALVFRVIITMRAFGTVWILTKGGPLEATQILSVLLYRVGFKYWQAGVAAAIAWLMLLATAALAARHVYRLYRESFAHA